MGVIDLDARVKKLEQEAGGGAVIDQLEAAVTALEETVNGDGETDLGLVGDVAALDEQINGDGETDFGLAGDVAELAEAVSQIGGGETPVKHELTLNTGLSANSTYGGCFYVKMGNLIYLHFALTGLTVGVKTTVVTLPSEARPVTSVFNVGYSNAASIPNYPDCSMIVGSDGQCAICSSAAAAYVTAVYTINETTPTP